jgi:hypothetical protein
MKTAEQIRQRREEMGDSHPLNRLKKHTEKSVADGAPLFVNRSNIGKLEQYQDAHPDSRRCELCGTSDMRVEPAFTPAWEPKMMCSQCRIGCAELLEERFNR